MNPSMLKISRFCAILVGLVLLASGLLKLLDPVGTGLIVQEYCRLCRNYSDDDIRRDT